ncbi:MAG TPA: hypothetical protein VE056_01990 [Pyrinomonadaceae bacterium]|nr:hypothetical protein [Pyrinomonadaceae bacterium]
MSHGQPGLVPFIFAFKFPNAARRVVKLKNTIANREARDMPKGKPDARVPEQVSGHCLKETRKCQ